MVDDLLCRGTPVDTVNFHDELEGPSGFECSEGSRKILTVGNDIDYCGLNISMTVSEGEISYSIDQIEGLVEMLDDLGMSDQYVHPPCHLLISYCQILPY